MNSIIVQNLIVNGNVSIDRAPGRRIRGGRDIRRGRHIRGDRHQRPQRNTPKFQQSWVQRDAEGIVTNRFDIKSDEIPEKHDLNLGQGKATTIFARAANRPRRA